jgi:hypothetical protein
MGPQQQQQRLPSSKNCHTSTRFANILLYIYINTHTHTRIYHYFKPTQRFVYFWVGVQIGFSVVAIVRPYHHQPHNNSNKNLMVVVILVAQVVVPITQVPQL